MEMDLHLDLVCVNIDHRGFTHRETWTRHSSDETAFNRYENSTLPYFRVERMTRLQLC